MDQPIYRRSRSGKNIYRIASSTAFTEVQLIGERALVHVVEAASYPERLRIADMIAMTDGHFVPCDEAEFNTVLGRSGTPDMFRTDEDRQG